MGLHDYVDFVQRNGQTLIPLVLLEDDDDDEFFEPGSAGSSDAIIVTIPKSTSKRDILSWSLSEFAKYPKIAGTYCWSDWEFKEVDGYDQVLQNSDAKWWDQCIWESPTYPNHYLVNFEPETFKAFVNGSVSAWQLPGHYLDEVFGNRSVTRPSTKELCLEKVLNAGVENLWEYDDKQLEPIILNFGPL